jgi:hypothetical protein
MKGEALTAESAEDAEVDQDTKETENAFLVLALWCGLAVNPVFRFLPRATCAW